MKKQEDTPKNEDKLAKDILDHMMQETSESPSHPSVSMSMFQTAAQATGHKYTSENTNSASMPDTIISTAIDPAGSMNELPDMSTAFQDLLDEVNTEEDIE